MRAHSEWHTAQHLNRSKSTSVRGCAAAHSPCSTCTQAHKPRCPHAAARTACNCVREPSQARSRAQKRVERRGERQREGLQGRGVRGDRTERGERGDGGESEGWGERKTRRWGERKTSRAQPHARHHAEAPARRPAIAYPGGVPFRGVGVEKAGGCEGAV
jgi:hypothetical protein